MGQMEIPQQVWRVGTLVQRSAVVIALAFVFLAVAVTALGYSVAGAATMWLVCILAMLTIWRLYLVPYVALTRDSLEIQGAFAHRSVEYRAINDARPGVCGVKIETTHQGALIAWAVQKSKSDERSHKHTVADDVVAAILARVQQASA